MKTTAERNRIDRRFSRCSKAIRWCRKHHLITKNMSHILIDKLDDMWFDSYR